MLNPILAAERNAPPSGKGSKQSAGVEILPNSSNGDQTDGQSNKHTWINDIFQGILTSETRCLNCETVRDFVELIDFSRIFMLTFLRFKML